MTGPLPFGPTPRWTPLRPHPAQHAYYRSAARFNVVPAGRRSGKTELAKRRLVRAAVLRGLAGGGPFGAGGRYFAAAPTRDQARRIYWNDLKALVPKACLAGPPRETELLIPLCNQVEIQVLGLDKPERIEGSPWDGGVLDEFADLRPEVWSRHVRPALSDRRGWCDLIGVPEGRNHFHDRYREALLDESGEWAVFHWPSADILPPEEIAGARRDLDPLTFQQEYEAGFVNFTGRAYYCFDPETHVSPGLVYDPDEPLIVCLDFNVSPGVAVVAQEQYLPGLADGDGRPVPGTGVIGEVHIPRNSNTPAVCRRLLSDFPDHRGPVRVYGDASGGAGGSAKVDGSDWDLVRRILGAHYGGRLDSRVPRSNPAERARVNAVNSRLRSADGRVRMLVDGRAAPRLVEDLEGVRLLEGGSGELDKRRDPHLSHLSDALGYYVVAEFPLDEEEEAGPLAVGGLY